MGIVAKQTLKGSIWSYLGVVIGFVTTTYLYTNYLTPEVVGLFGLIVAIATITSVLAALGFNGVTIRLFPYFRDQKSGHHGFLFAILVPQIIGFLIFTVLFYLFKEYLILTNIEKSALFAEYVELIVPVTFFFLIYNLFDNYLKVLYDAVTGTFLQEFFQRVLIFIIVLLYALEWIDFEQLIWGFVFAVSAKGLVIIILVAKRGELKLQPNIQFISRKMRREIIDVAIFYIFGGVGSMIVFNIDKIIVNQMLDLRNTGIYTIAFYFGTLVIIPSRPLLKIAGTLVADAWAKNDLSKIDEIYRKSCINQFLIGCFLFMGIWVNIDSIITILGSDYVLSKWVIFFVGLGYLFEMATGASGIIISISKYYRVFLWFMSILVLLVIVLLYLLIPLWGITGAAIAIAAALFMHNLMRSIYLYHKFRLQPFSKSFFYVVFFYGLLYLILNLIPQQNLIADIIIRSGLVVVLSMVFLLFIPISEDVTRLKDRLIHKVQ
ncbi:MAG: oligosaccharide flippase family protein [Prolixibacteraceae bacterium]|nr:oligosaccharide flippase family protein [Prolixibacteraceae bacterium]